MSTTSFLARTKWGALAVNRASFGAIRTGKIQAFILRFVLNDGRSEINYDRPVSNNLPSFFISSHLMLSLHQHQHCWEGLCH